MKDNEAQPQTTKWPRYETCPTCDGSGLISHYSDGSPNECQTCGATGRVMARDERGRFLPWEVVTSNG